MDHELDLRASAVIDRPGLVRPPAPKPAAGRLSASFRLPSGDLEERPEYEDCLHLACTASQGFVW